MQQQFDNEIALFVRDERTGYAFNAQALKALGIDAAEARDRGYSLKRDRIGLPFRRHKRSRLEANIA